MLLGFFLLNSACAAVCGDPPAALLGLWRGEENAADTVGLNHGLLLNGAAYTNGTRGSAFNFDGGDGVLSIPHSEAWNFGTNDFTIQLWVNFAQIKKSMFLYHKDGTGSGGWEFGFDYPANTLFFNHASGSQAIGRSWGGALDTNIWHHVAVTRSNQTYRLYRNGALRGSPQNDTNAIAPVTGELCAAHWDHSQNQKLVGSLDEIAIFDRALTTAEISALSQGYPVESLQPACFTSAPATNVVAATYPHTFTIFTANAQSYQWLKNGTPIPGIATNALTLTNVQPADAGSYSVVMSNLYGLVTSAPVALTVVQPLSVATHAGTLYGYGTNGGPAPLATFVYPYGLARDPSGNFFVSDNYNFQIRKISADGLVSTFANAHAESGTNDGPGLQARFMHPLGLACDAAGNVFVADRYAYTIRKISPDGVVTTLAGLAQVSGTNDGTGSAARFYEPQCVATDAAGNVYVGESSAIRRITPAGVVTTLLNSNVNQASAITLDAAGNIYFADANFVVQKLATNGALTTLAGESGVSGLVDGLGADARLSFMAGLACDAAGNLLATDYNFGGLRRITPAGLVTTLAGTVVAFGDGVGAAVGLGHPAGLALDARGRIYVADHSYYNIRRADFGVVIGHEPISQAVALGGNATLQVTAAGELPLAYQWRFNNVPLADATNATLEIVDFQITNIGHYTVVVTNALAAATSEVARLVLPALQLAALGRGVITADPALTNYVPGQSVTLTATPRNPNWTRFVSWNDGDTNATRVITVGYNNDFTAVFTNFVPLESLSVGWDVNFGGSNEDQLRSVVPASDGGFLLGGFSQSPASGNKLSANFGGMDFWVIKVNPAGERQWERVFGGTDRDHLHRIHPTADGGYLLAGYSGSLANGNKTNGNIGYMDYWVVKIDAGGTNQWQKSFGGENWDEITRVEDTADGGYLLIGNSYQSTLGNKTLPGFGNFDIWVVKIDQAGHKLWERIYGGTDIDSVYASARAPDGGYLLGGYSQSLPGGGNKTSGAFGDYDGWLVKVDASGNKQWDFTLGGTNFDQVTSIMPTPDGGFLVSLQSVFGTGGNKSGPGFGGSDIWMVKIDGAGNILSQTVLGGALDEYNSSIAPAPDGDFWVAGQSASAPGGTRTAPNLGPEGVYDMWLVKVDASGAQLEDFAFGGTDHDFATVIRQPSPDSFIVGGESRSGANGTKTTPNYGERDFWLVNRTIFEAPSGTPAFLLNSALVNEQTNIFHSQSPITLTITSSWNGPIHFTTDGSEPDFTATLYDPQNPPQVAPPATVKAIAYLDDLYLLNGLYVDYSEVVVTRLEFVPLYTVNISTPGGGTVAVNPAVGPYALDTEVTLTATNLPGWTFLGWQGDVTDTNPVVTVTLTSNVSAQAIFGTTLTTNATTAGNSIARTPALALYPYGSTVRLTALPAAARYLAFWTGALSGAISPQEITFTNANPVVGAIFGTLVSPNFGLTVQISGEGTVSYAPATNRFASNSVVTLTATPKPGWAFVNWTGGSNTSANPLALVMHTNKVMTAVFTESTETNSPPSVVLTNPAPGAVFTTPASIVWQASATDSDGSVVSVQLRDGTNVLATISAPPFEFTWTNASLGAHTLTVVATDNGGLSTTSAPVSITVQTAVPEIVLNSPTNGNVFLAPVNVLVSALVSDADSSVGFVSFYDGTNWLGSVTNPPFRLTWTNTPLGAHSFYAVAHDVFGPVVTSSPPAVVTVTSTATNPPVFSWSNAVVEVGEASGSIMLHVFKSADSAQVPADIGFHPQSASADTADFTPPGFSLLSFAVGETVKPITIPIIQDSLVESNHFFFMVLDLISGSISGATDARVTILDDDVPGTNSLFTRVAPNALPSPLATLRVDLTPTNVGQWRFVWENSWHEGGASVAGLPPGNYEIQFKPVSGYVEPLATYVAVITNTLNAYSFIYSNTAAPQLGSLVVNINPAFVATNGNPNERGQWRRAGEGVWHDSGETVDALPAGAHIIEFKLLTAGSWQTPSAQEVTVLPNQLNTALGEYFVANPTPGTGPTPLSFGSQVQNSFGFQRGYQFVGQLLTPLGWGSGTVVKQRVVLTAAHVVFDDYALAFVPNDSVKWFFQRQAGEYEPAPQTPRGFVVSSGYAAQRQAEATPGLSGTASRDLDIAALYFGEAAGRGGFSGYLVSKPGEEWLQIATAASLAGYPVEGIPAQDRGKMHRTEDQAVSWSAVSNQVYATTDIKSYPGNSGGPILVQLATNVNYWPAAVYLGGSGNTIVRAIDALAVGLINTAEALGNAGGNNTGGEPPRRATDCPTCSPLIYGTLEVSLTPTNIGALGGGYRFKNATNGVIYREPFNRFFVLGNVPWTIEFLPAPYTIAPTNRILTTTAGTTNKTTGLYKQWGQLTFSDGHLRVLGSSGAVYRIDFKPTLTTNVWTPVRTQSLSGAGLTLTNLVPGASNGFFRAVLVP